MTHLNEIKLSYKSIKLHVDIYEHSRNAPVVIVVPGTGSHAGNYAQFCETLSDKGYNVLPFDLMGHGKSGGERGVFSMYELLENISTVISYAESKYSNKIGLIGTSQGGEVALHAALHDKRINAVICHNVLLTYKFPINLKVKFIKSWICSMLCNIIPDFYFPLKLAFNWGDVYNDPTHLQRKFEDPLAVWHYKFKSYRTIFTHIPEYPIEDLQTPILIAVGENDKLVPREHCKKIYDMLTCQKEFYVMPNANHQLLIDYLDIFAPIVDVWFKKTL